MLNSAYAVREPDTGFGSGVVTALQNCDRRLRGALSRRITSRVIPTAGGRDMCFSSCHFTGSKPFLLVLGCVRSAGSRRAELNRYAVELLTVILHAVLLLRY
jgi:hypothetical protein